MGGFRRPNLIRKHHHDSRWKERATETQRGISSVAILISLVYLLLRGNDQWRPLRADTRFLFTAFLYSVLLRGERSHSDGHQDPTIGNDVRRTAALKHAGTFKNT